MAKVFSRSDAFPRKYTGIEILVEANPEQTSTRIEGLVEANPEQTATFLLKLQAHGKNCEKKGEKKEFHVNEFWNAINEAPEVFSENFTKNDHLETVRSLDEVVVSTKSDWLAFSYKYGADREYVKLKTNPTEFIAKLDQNQYLDCKMSVFEGSALRITLRYREASTSHGSGKKKLPFQ